MARVRSPRNATPYTVPAGPVGGRPRRRGRSWSLSWMFLVEACAQRDDGRDMDTTQVSQLIGAAYLKLEPSRSETAEGRRQP